jgi:hypothetical protein
MWKNVGIAWNWKLQLEKSQILGFSNNNVDKLTDNLIMDLDRPL